MFLQTLYILIYHDILYRLFWFIYNTSFDNNIHFISLVTVTIQIFYLPCYFVRKNLLKSSYNLRLNIEWDFYHLWISCRQTFSLWKGTYTDFCGVNLFIRVLSLLFTRVFNSSIHVHIGVKVQTRFEVEFARRALKGVFL